MDKIDQQLIEDLPVGKKPKGENVIHICRVTGYFSIIQNWNKGKVAELADRHRSTVDDRR